METPELLLSALFVSAGLFSLISSVLNFDWFFNSRRAATFVSMFGRTGARVFYGLLGLGLVVCGAIIFLGK
jgi:hypothetical protein